jgi:di/tricarboxylate transporter
MTLTPLDFRTFATVAIFLVTYAGVALGRVPGFRIDRAGIALIGARLMIGLGTVSLDEAYKAIDLDAITLLLGMPCPFGTRALSRNRDRHRDLLCFSRE